MAEAAVAQRPAASATTVLNVKGLQAWYNESHILHGVDRVRRKGAHRPFDRPHRPAWRRILPGGAGHIRISLGQGESISAASDLQGRRDERGAHLCALSQLTRAAVERRGQAIRRRAADARYRANLANRR